MRQPVMARANADIEVYQQDPSFPRESSPALAEIMKFAYAYRASMSVDATTIEAPTDLALFLAGSDSLPNANPIVCPTVQNSVDLQGVSLPLAVPRGLEPDSLNH
jgi:hypothetical protein